MTLGEQRVGVNFNPSQKEEVAKVKETCAFLIDYLDAYKNGITVQPENAELNPARFNYEYAETFRLINIAQLAIEEASIWAVKALTK